MCWKEGISWGDKRTGQRWDGAEIHIFSLSLMEGIWEYFWGSVDFWGSCRSGLSACSPQHNTHSCSCWGVCCHPSACHQTTSAPPSQATIQFSLYDGKSWEKLSQQLFSYRLILFTQQSPMACVHFLSSLISAWNQTAWPALIFKLSPRLNTLD